ncbi:MAG: pilus assembly protein [Anaerolineae bacterium]|nr:pilus assembly protein [Anaerolineae bacterium]
MLRKWLPISEKGQSLVELVIVTPLLIFLMIGVFEVGWVLRGYLVLVNVNREITRFSVRPGYLNFSSQDDIQTSWDSIETWVYTSLAGQLPLNFDPDPGDVDPDVGNATLIISHLVADTGSPCEDINGSECSDCTAFEDPNYNPFPQDDLIIHPGMPKFKYQATTIGPDETVTGPRTTRRDYEEMSKKLAAQNNEFNCEILKRGGVASANNVIITELYYDQPQLFGFPLISNPFTDPVPLYTHTTMRLIGAARSTGTSSGNLLKSISYIGPLCLTYPVIADATEPGFTTSQPINIIKDGWLKWNPSTTDSDAQYLGYALQFPQMSLNDFVDPSGGTDTLQKNSQVAKITGSQQVKPMADALVGQAIIIPYSNNPAANPVTINGFKWATISEVLPDDGSDEVNQINAIIDQSEVPEACSSTP